MRLRSLFSFLLVFTSIQSIGQTIDNPCGHVSQTEKWVKRFGEEKFTIEKNALELESFTKAFIANPPVNVARAGEKYIIPVVFHVIHNNGPENIDDQQIYDQVERLNLDFRGQNSDMSQIKPEFFGIAADCEIEFRLAKKDPLGNCTNGITRTVSSKTNDGDQSMKNLIQWPRENYMNVWVCANAGGTIAPTSGGIVAGYTYKPPMVNTWKAGDGIVLSYSYCGLDERTLTHEVGHWLNLDHTWGPSNQPGDASNCAFDDNVGDTPETVGELSAICNKSRESCGSLDNVENYMDYSGCPKMYTIGQKLRMHAALESSMADRNNLWTVGNLTLTGVTGPDEVCKARFTTFFTAICVGQSIQFKDQSFHNISEWNWDFGANATPSVSTDQNPFVSYNAPGKYPVTLTVSDGVNSVSETKTEYIFVMSADDRKGPIDFDYEVNNLDETPWFSINADGDDAWNVTDRAAYKGNKSIFLRNVFNDDDLIDEFVSEPIDLSNLTDVVITFKVAYARRQATDDDELRVYVSKDCGLSWSRRTTLRGQNLETVGYQSGDWAPADNSEWKEITINNIFETYLVDNFRVKFEFISGGGNNVYIDDLNITGPVGIEITPNLVEGWNLYPNPMDESSAVSVNLKENTTLTMTVRDVFGKVVQAPIQMSGSTGENKMLIQKANLSKGIYLVELLVGNRKLTKKLIVQ